MPSIQATVAAPEGLHARPASLFVQEAARQPVKITVGRPGSTPVDARSLLAVMTLGARHGETLELTAEEGDEALPALQALASLLTADTAE
ncbi:HPr family phosphocarrier protein [Streptomyces sp. DSM 41972]|uniref:Phosphocarrier protein HPr n=1 Tax=Streptomyces althioticus subsp. attaecolombicae TaxID=3075534 RepID=A0ABU3I3U7_9ACTN|nr:HPr family phosphocarrier protein [Streptomyces sp. DSM 41972]SCD41020.1 Phosphocarrier protein HPr [Streptomyces sp. di188]SCD48733.1 Phosphocarrier protein HPr [Streptomyces sp. di50b]